MDIVLHTTTKNKCEYINQPTKKTSPKKRIGHTIFFTNNVGILARNAVVGSKEYHGPLKKHFAGEFVETKGISYEHAEIEMLDEAISGVIKKSKLKHKNIDVMLCGDLINQITPSCFVARTIGAPFLGLFSACSTLTESLAIGAMMIDGGYAQNAICATSSHFATAERQFRYPLEYGCQRPPQSQWTVTGAGATMLARGSSLPQIRSATIGKVLDLGIKDISNMGAAMAPAAADTLMQMFHDTRTSVADYDMIFTGDLGYLGSCIFRDLLMEQGIDLANKYSDCGCLIFASSQDTAQGGSGCGCSASVFNTYILDMLECKKYNKVAVLATGALTSSLTCFQGDSIPSISHAVIVEGAK